MSLINCYGPCIGLTLYSFGPFRAEIWLIPAGYEIIEHTHPNEDVELAYIAGSSTFFRRDETTGIAEKFSPKWPQDFGRKFTVKSTHSHWFSVSKWPLVFINFQRFLNNTPPMSAAQDFKIYGSSSE